jgi:hypothetical protein
MAGGDAQEHGGEEGDDQAEQDVRGVGWESGWFGVGCGGIGHGGGPCSSGDFYLTIWELSSNFSYIRVRFDGFLGVPVIVLGLEALLDETSAEGFDCSNGQPCHGGEKAASE